MKRKQKRTKKRTKTNPVDQFLSQLTPTLQSKLDQLREGIEQQSLTYLGLRILDRVRQVQSGLQSGTSKRKKKTARKKVTRRKKK